MNRIFGCSMLFLLMLTGSSSARVWYVMPDSTGQVINIQVGIDSCESGDTVLVAPGIYKGDGNRDLDFRGKAIIVISERRYNPSISDSSFIDCEGTQDTDHRGFYFHRGETNASVLVGLVILNGYESEGGGILCDSSSSPMLKDNTIRNCSARGRGAGICCVSSSPIIRDNDIDSNHTRGYGCGIYCISSSAVIEYNDIHNDSNYWHEGASGVGICCISSSPTIANNNIFNNGVARGYGAGIYCDSCSSVTISQNDVYANYAGEASGGGIFISNSSAWVYGNRVYGNGCGPGLDGGGGVYVSGSNLTLSYNELSENSGWVGAALACDSSRINMMNNNIHHNIATGPSIGHVVSLRNMMSSVVSNNAIMNNEGGGVWFREDISGATAESGRAESPDQGLEPASSNVVINNQIIGNSGSYEVVRKGAGLLIENASPTIENNLIVANNGRIGGGISCESSSPVISGNTIVSNVSSESGGGVFVDSLSRPLLLNNIIANNQGSGGIYTDTDTLTIMCCDVYNNEGDNYIGIPDQTGMNNNISADPFFCPEGYPEFTLHSDSPCAPYMNHNCGLIGANPVTCAQTGSDEFNELISAYKLNQNYPNPFNPETRIVFDLKEASPVSLKVYDVNGRVVRTLIEGKRESGRHELAWDGKDDGGRDVASGVYFYRLTAGSFSETKKMVLLK